MTHPTERQLITTVDELRAIVPALARLDVLVLDTEFVRVDTFRPKVGLLQIAGEGVQYLVDPVTVTDLSPLAALITGSDAVKVLHSGSEDLEVLKLLFGAMPGRMHDTQIAAAFLGMGLQVGFAKLVQQLLGLEIPKDEARSDWLARPLSEGQLDYAALDVKYLRPCYDILVERLKAQGLWDWFDADCALMVAELGEEANPLDAWRDFSNAWRLEPRQLGALKALSDWRELEARRRDEPRGFLLKSAALFEVARVRPNGSSALAAIEGVTPRQVRLHGERIVRIVREAEEAPASWPRRLPPPLPRESRTVYGALKEQVDAIAARIGVPAEVLMRKRWLDALVLGVVDQGEAAELPAALRGWREALVTQPLLTCLQGFPTELKAWRALRRTQESV